MTDQPATEQTSQERLQAALDAFAEQNRLRPNGMPEMQIPPMLDLAGRIDALVALLIEKDVVTEAEFVERLVRRKAEQVEELVAQFREAKRSVSGLVIAGPGQRV